MSRKSLKSHGITSLLMPRNELESIIVSFKQNLRIINKATNVYTKYENGKR